MVSTCALVARSKESRKRFMCLDCRVDTGKIGEHYMLVDSTWRQAHDSAVGMLCIGCIELRLGRRLVKADFNSSHVNNIKNMSNRLVERIVS